MGKPRKDKEPERIGANGRKYKPVAPLEYIQMDDIEAIFGVNAPTAREFLSRQAPAFQEKVEAARAEHESSADALTHSKEQVLHYLIEWNAEKIENRASGHKREDIGYITDAIARDAYADISELPPAYADILPPDILERVKDHIRLYARLFPVTIYLRAALREDKEYKAQRAARDKVIEFFIRDANKGRAEFSKLMTPDILNTAAKECERTKREEWANDYRRLAGKWAAASDGERAGLIAELTLYEMSYLYRVREAIGGGEPVAPPLETMTAHPEKIAFPVEKINSRAFRSLEEITMNGQGYFVDTGIKDHAGNAAPVILSIDYSELPQEIRKRLTPYDRRVMTIYAQLMAEQNIKTIDDYKPITISSICTNMGHAPTAANREKVSKSLEKMGKIRITLDNENESANSNYTKIKYTGYLLPHSKVEAIDRKSGKMVEGAIIPMLSPANALTKSPAPFVEWARMRKEITTVTREQIKSPLSLTDNNIAVEDYIIERVRRYGNKGYNNGNMIKLSTIFDECGIESASQRIKLADKIDAELLPHYESTGLFKIINREYKKERTKNTLRAFTFEPL